jgi:hypothetical protein
MLGKRVGVGFEKSVILNILSGLMNLNHKWTN